jgi:hypothetical protein
VKMPTIRRMGSMYKRTMLQEGLGITRRNEVQMLAQNAFYLGAQTTLQALATLLEDGEVEQVHRIIEQAQGPLYIQGRDCRSAEARSQSIPRPDARRRGSEVSAQPLEYSRHSGLITDQTSTDM